MEWWWRWRGGGGAVEFNQMQNSHSGCWPAGMHSCFSYVTGRPLHPKLPPTPQLFLKTALSLFSQPLRALFSPSLSLSLFPAVYPRLTRIYKQREWLCYKLVTNVSCAVISRVVETGGKYMDVELNVGLLSRQDSILETVKKKKKKASISNRMMVIFQ